MQNFVHVCNVNFNPRIDHYGLNFVIDLSHTWVPFSHEMDLMCSGEKETRIQVQNCWTWLTDIKNFHIITVLITYWGCFFFFLVGGSFSFHVKLGGEQQSSKFLVSHSQKFFSITSSSSPAKKSS